MIGRHLLTAALGLVLVLASCAKEQPTGGGGSEVSITVESPTDGDQVASPSSSVSRSAMSRSGPPTRG